MLWKPKTAKTDYRPDMLPTTRMEVFWDVLSLHFGKLMLLALVSLVCCMPLAAIEQLQDTFEISVYDERIAGNITSLQAGAVLTAYGNLLPLAESLLYIPLGLGLSGIAQVIKKLCWEEPVRLGRDLKKGIQQSGKHYCLLFLLVGMVRFACVYAARMTPLPGILSALLLGPVAAYLSVTVAVYDLNPLQHLRYALLLLSKAPLKTMGVYLVCFGGLMIRYLPNPACHFFGTLGAGLLAPIVMLGWFSFGLSRLDQDINPTRYPQLVGKGLFDPAQYWENIE